MAALKAIALTTARAIAVFLTERRDRAIATRMVLCLVAGCLAFSGWAARADVAPPWVELGDDGSLSIRTIVAAGMPCPTVTADGSELESKKRFGPDDRFPTEVCEARAAPNAAKLAVAARPVPSLPATVRRIVVIGDTGCRIEGREIQDCRDPKDWPFHTIAERAAARHPDLVIHVGDYLYRLSPCPAGNAGCGGSPYGDNWASWQADFIDPAQPLLSAAPWVLVRGNHEMCRRGGEGWRRLLDPHPAQLACSEFGTPYHVSSGGLDLLVFDSADADDFKTEPDKVAVFRSQMKKLLAGAPPHSWLVTHRPVWALAGGMLTGLSVNLTEQAAVKDQVPAGLDLVMAGHLHDFAAYAFGSARPSQLVVGTGGDTLLDLAAGPIAGADIDGLPITEGFARKAYGYLVFDRTDAGWDGVFYSPDDAIIARCTLRGRGLNCQ